MTPVEPPSGKKLSDLVLRNKVPDGKFEKIKQPNFPFYVIKTGEEMDNLDKLSREYRRSLKKKSAHSKTPKRRNNEDSYEDTADNGHDSDTDEDCRFPEEP